MSMTQPPDTGHDPELNRLLDAVVDLAAERVLLGPDAFLAALDDLAGRFQRLLPYRTERALTQSLSSFARRRFELIDDPSEYPLAAEEVMLLSTLLQASAPLAIPATKLAVELLSARLTEEGAPAVFGKLLKHLRQLAHLHADPELAAWVRGVVAALPDDGPS